MPWDYTSVFKQFLGVDGSLEVKITPSPMHSTFATIRKEVVSLKDIILQTADSYTAATLSSNACLLDSTPFTEEECTLFDARIAANLTHITKLINDVLNELKLYVAKEVTEDMFDTEKNTMELLERQLWKDNNKNAVQYFESVGMILFTQATQIYEDFRSLRTKRHAVVSSDFLREKSRRQIHRLNSDTKDNGPEMETERKSFGAPIDAVDAQHSDSNPGGGGSATVNAIPEPGVEEKATPATPQVPTAPTSLTGIWSTIDSINKEDHDSYHTSQVHGVTMLAQRRILPQLMEEINIVRRTEETAREIQALNAVFAEKVMEQSEQIDRIYATTFEVDSTLDGANKYLKKAAKKLRGGTKITVVLMCLAIFCLLFLDYVN